MLSALAGGFTWVINDLIGRFRRHDFTVSDIYISVFRVLIAAPFGWAFAELVKRADIGVPLAFLLGAFPTGTLLLIARRLAGRKLGVSENPGPGSLEIAELQSMTKANAERFFDEGISAAVQLAYADPVDLTIRTNFDFNYVIDCVSQALLWIYLPLPNSIASNLEDRTKRLAKCPLRGAQEAANLVDDLGKGKPEAIGTLNDIAAALAMSPASLQTTLEQVAHDPYTRFIRKTWR